MALKLHYHFSRWGGLVLAKFIFVVSQSPQEPAGRRHRGLHSTFAQCCSLSGPPRSQPTVAALFWSAYHSIDFLVIPAQNKRTWVGAAYTKGFPVQAAPNPFLP